jgi:hypothetical protein
MAVIRKHRSRYATASGEIGSHGVRIDGNIVFNFSLGEYEVQLTEKELREIIKQWRKQAEEFGLHLEDL